MSEGKFSVYIRMYIYIYHSQDPQPQSLSFNAALKVLQYGMKSFWTEAFKVMIQDRVNRPRKHAEERVSGEGTVL